MFAAWPLLYAASFSGLYLAMFLVLAALILRPVGFNFRNKMQRSALAQYLGLGACSSAASCRRWSSASRSATCFSGVPFHFDALERPVFAGGLLTLLRPFALLVGLVSLSMLVMHGTVLRGHESGTADGGARDAPGT